MSKGHQPDASCLAKLIVGMACPLDELLEKAEG